MAVADHAIQALASRVAMHEEAAFTARFLLEGMMRLETVANFRNFMKGLAL